MNARQVATAIVASCPRAGRTFGAAGESPEQRVENLLADRPPYGAYIVEGDPHGWGEGGDVAPAVTIHMEPKGLAGDCELPLDYYGSGCEVAGSASDRLPGLYYIEFINAAVACVYPE